MVSNTHDDIDQVRDFLARYNLARYFEVFVQEGFDRLLSLFDITETDLISLHVKRGHRRLLQRAIATARGIPLSTPILINYGYDEPGISHMPKPGTQYDCYSRRSPKPYVNYRKRKQYIPSKPVLAFDKFLNELKTEFTTKSPTAVISMAYERWNMLGPFEKEKYERLALHANSDYVMRTPAMSERDKNYHDLESP
ncbi:hypothetical protein BDF21DRAFT_417643 [Thamnidium elegans]|nr:hypothetical protein BDF21DRAFT_417643 [Thamnidium elegans]